MHLAARLLTFLILAAAAGCQTPPSRIISPGPKYYGVAVVARLYVYVFADMRPEYSHPVFRKTFEERLKAALDDAHVASRQLWFMDTFRGESLNKDRKNSTLGNVTFVSVGKTIKDNAREDIAFGPTHRLIVFPTGTLTSGSLASLELKWDVLDAKTGNYEWSVYARTPDIGPSMSDDAAAQAARTLVDAVVHEMLAKGVLGGA